MSKDFARIIADYRERSARLLQEAEPNSTQQYAYSHILQVFDQSIAGSPNEQVVVIPPTLKHLSRLLSHPEARSIVREWAESFARDTGQER